MELSSAIPNLYLPIVSAYKKLRFVEIDAVICTTTGQLITFFKQTPVSCCDIENNNCVSEIFEFNTYSPYAEYFILKSNDGNIVVVKNDESQPKIFETFDRIFAIEIGDFWFIGSPQVKLSTADSFFITNFLITGKSSSPIVIDNTSYKRRTEFVISLDNHSHRLRSHVRSFEKSLRMKRNFRATMIENLLNEEEELIVESPFEFVAPFKTIFNQRWCVFFVLRNTSEFIARRTCVSLRSSFNSVVAYYRVRWFCYHRNASKSCEFNRVRSINELLRPKNVYIVVISFPLNTFPIGKNIISIQPILLYTVNNNDNDDNILFVNMPKFALNISDLTDRKIRILNGDNPNTRAHLFDILSIVATSVMAQFKITITTHLSVVSMHDTLVRCGCRTIDRSCCYYLHPISPVCGDILLRVKMTNPTEWLFEMYAKNGQDQMYFLLKLSSYLKMDVRKNHRATHCIGGGDKHSD